MGIHEVHFEVRALFKGVAIGLAHGLRAVTPIPNLVKTIVGLGIVRITFETSSDVDAFAEPLRCQPGFEHLEPRRFEHELGFFSEDSRASRDRQRREDERDDNSCTRHNA